MILWLSSPKKQGAGDLDTSVSRPPSRVLRFLGVIGWLLMVAAMAEVVTR